MKYKKFHIILLTAALGLNMNTIMAADNLEPAGVKTESLQENVKQSKPEKPTLDVVLKEDGTACITIEGPQNAKIYFLIVTPEEKDETIENISTVTNKVLYPGFQFQIQQAKGEIILAVATYDDQTYSDVAEYDTRSAIAVAQPDVKVAQTEADNDTEVKVTMTTKESDGEIYYTTDGSSPDEKSNKYMGPFTVTGKDTTIQIKAITVKNGSKSAEIWKYVEFRKAKPVGKVPVQPEIEIRTLEGGRYYIVITGQELEDIYFNIISASEKDEVEKDIKKVAKYKYTAPFEVENAKDTVILAVTTYDQQTYSDITAKSLIPEEIIPVPQITSRSKAVNGEQVLVTINAQEGEGDIYYTTDGSEPTINTKKYTGPFIVTGKDDVVTVKAVRVKNGKLSGVKWKQIQFEAGQTESLVAPVINADKTEAENNEIVNVSIDTSKINGQVYYTTDGTAPTTNSLQYTGLFTVTGKDEIISIKAATFKDGKISEVSTQNIIFKAASGTGGSTGGSTGSTGGSTGSTGGSTGSTGGSSSSSHSSSSSSSRSGSGKSSSTDSSKAKGTDHTETKTSVQEKDSVQLTDNMKKTDNTVQAPDVQFTDMQGHWASDTVAAVVKKGLFKGISSTEFGPDIKVNRAMLVTILQRLDNNSSKVTQNIRFNDVKSKDYFYDAVTWAADNKIVNGVSKESFAPLQEVTREQMAVILYNYIQFKHVTLRDKGNNIVIKDADKNSAWANDKVVAIIKSGIMSVDSNGNFNPKSTATRAELATVVMRYITLYGEK